MINQKNITCLGCGACYNICPAKCIRMEPDQEGFRLPVVDSTECIACGSCLRVCPELTTKTREEQELRIFAVKNRDLQTRLLSSSGGAFSCLADAVLQQGGIVFGAGFDRNTLTVRHYSATSPEEFESMRGSKYVQSDTGESFAAVRSALEKKQTVLFSGTPCQVAGLYSFMGGEWPPELITVDTICHGVASPMVLDRYMHYLIEKNGSEIRQIRFRDKRNGWRDYGLSISFANGKVYYRKRNSDPFLRGYLDNLFLRESCYTCRYKGQNRFSDLTLADFGGVENELPEMDDDKGVSLVITHTEKGRRLLENMSQTAEINVLEDLGILQKYNAAGRLPARRPAERDAFFATASDGDIVVALKQFSPRNYPKEIRDGAKRIAKKLLCRR